MRVRAIGHIIQRVRIAVLRGIWQVLTAQLRISISTLRSEKRTRWQVCEVLDALHERWVERHVVRIVRVRRVRRLLMLLLGFELELVTR